MTEETGENIVMRLMNINEAINNSANAIIDLQCHISLIATRIMESNQRATNSYYQSSSYPRQKDTNEAPNI